MLTTDVARVTVPLARGIEGLFGTRDENIRLLEQMLHIKTRLLSDSMEIEGEPDGVARAYRILDDYFALIAEGQVFNNGDLNSYLRVVTCDGTTTLRALVNSGKQRTFGKKVLTPKNVNQRRYIDAIERHDLVFGVGPAGTGKTYLAVAMAVSAFLSKRVSRIVLTRPAVEAGEKLGFLPGTLKEKIDPYLRPLYDALYDMIDSEKVEKLIERQVIDRLQHHANVEGRRRAGGGAGAGGRAGAAANQGRQPGGDGFVGLLRADVVNVRVNPTGG